MLQNSSKRLLPDQRPWARSLTVQILEHSFKSLGIVNLSVRNVNEGRDVIIRKFTRHEASEEEFGRLP